MPIFKGVNVYVTVDGQKLPEFDDDDEESQPPNTVTKYIEAVTGAEFKVEIRAESDFDQAGCKALRFGVALDGEDMDHAVLELVVCRSSYLDGVRRCSKGNWTNERFKFSEIVITEQSSSSKPQDLQQFVDNLGLITVRILRARDVYYDVRSSDWSSNRNPKLTSTPVPLKALKGSALSHQASLGPPQKSRIVNQIRCDYIESRDTPFAEFRFKYRSQKGLQDMCIIPRPSTPVPLEERPKDQLTREELLELLGRQPGKPEAKPDTKAQIKVKRERDPEYDELMSTARTRKVARIKKPVEVIDLLD